MEMTFLNDLFNSCVKNTLFSNPITYCVLLVVCYTSDIDECTEQTARCTDICLNTIGSYACSCYPGYFLNETDNAQCHGAFDECRIVIE